VKGRRSRISIGARAGNAGVVASFAMALAGIAIGAAATYFGERGAAARAAKIEAAAAELSVEERAFQEREKIVRRVLTGAPPERLPVPQILANAPENPKIIIIFDDMGLDPAAVETVSALPGPLTLSFLPYAKNVSELARTASLRGAEVMLHLPMQPQGDADPGPHALRTSMTGADFIKELEWNLGRLSNYVGVNNHMGSEVTTDEAAMKTVLAYLKHKGLFFLDSVTTGDTVVRAAGAMVGATVFSRDVFLDADVNNKTAVENQLRLVERIARETGFAVAICHPYPETIEVLGPWLATAPFRGFDIAPVSALIDIHARNKPTTMAQAPSLRL